jgi:hypothetical protein
MLSTRSATQEVAALTVAVEALRQSAPPLDDQIVTFTPQRIVRAMDEAGEVYCTLVPQAEVGFVPTSKSEYPARIAKVELEGLEALTSFMERGPAYQYRDLDLWNEAVRFAADASLDGNACLTLSRTLSVALLIRRGVSNVSARDLP